MKVLEINFLAEPQKQPKVKISQFKLPQKAEQQHQFGEEYKHRVHQE